MTVRITQTEEPAEELADNRALLRVEGALTKDGAALLEHECAKLLARYATSPVLINLKDVLFLDEEGAAILRRLGSSPRVAFEECQLFTQQMLEPSASLPAPTF